MIRTLLVAAALTVAAPAAFAQDFTSDDYANGVTVQGQLPDSYIIRIDTRGKDERSIRAEIWDAAWTACQRAPSTGNFADVHVASMEACVSQANDDAVAQLHGVMHDRRLTETVAYRGY